MNKNNMALCVPSLLRQAPQALAVVRGNTDHPDIQGNVLFYQLTGEVLVVAEVTGLPTAQGQFNNPIFAFHIHDGNACTGNAEDPFADAGQHYNPYNRPHPYHAGDLPPLFGNEGYAFSAFVTNRFSVREILGKTIIIHAKPDDFTTQPSGNAGEKIACGKIIGGD